VSDRAARPYQGRVRAGAKGIVPGAGLEPACAGFKDRPGCQQPTPDRGAFPQCRPERAALTGRSWTPVRKASCARRESDPHGPCGPHGPQPCASTIPPRAHGAATRCRPGSPAVRKRGRSRARRRGFRGWARTSVGRIQNPAGQPSARPEMYGRRDSHPHAARFELARSALPSLPRAPPRP
jgi:hypothetical protein